MCAPHHLRNEGEERHAQTDTQQHPCKKREMKSHPFERLRLFAVSFRVILDDLYGKLLQVNCGNDKDRDLYAYKKAKRNT